MESQQDKPKKKVSLELPLIPLKDVVIFPHMIIPIFLNEESDMKAVDEALAADRKIFLAALRVEEDKEEADQLSHCYEVGTICTIMRTRHLPDGRRKVLVQGLERAQIVQTVKLGKYTSVSLNNLPDQNQSESFNELEALLRAVRWSLEKVVSLGRILSPDILMVLEDVSEPGRLADLIAANLGLKILEAQEVLAESSTLTRLQKIHLFLSKEIEVYEMQTRIQSQAKQEIGKMQKEHYLREQIRALRTELGDGDSKDEIDSLWKEFEQVKLSDQARNEVSRQLNRLERMHQDSGEAALVRQHIETILRLPWNIESKDQSDLLKVIEVLDGDHFGLQQVKDRIIEYLAVKILNSKVKGPILCFVGPPGVGKTSLGESIARAIGRKFSRISLGGVRDEADIRGHRKTYVGAYPGRIIQSIKQAGTNNPIIMLDEIDKLGSDHRGDPAAALLETLDPEQNIKFTDHYLGVDFNLSKIMFIANANSLDTIPLALRDRLEIIEVSGYSEQEKLEIAKKFLISKQAKENGLTDYKIYFEHEGLIELIRGYTRESGLRGFEKKIASVFRKIARSIAESSDKELGKTWKVSKADVTSYLGSKLFQNTSPELGIGVSFGLAYTPQGGDVLTIETTLIDNQAKQGNLVLTGCLGDVMKESALAALNYIRSHQLDLGIDSQLIQNNDIHIHVPQGAIPKEGPSAGVALVSSILSSLLKKEIFIKCCMTGEVTLHGRVLGVGGLREKILAARREKVYNLFLPLQNKETVLSFPKTVTKNLNIIFVSHFKEIFIHIFPLKTKKSKKKEITNSPKKSCEEGLSS